MNVITIALLDFTQTMYKILYKGNSKTEAYKIYKILQIKGQFVEMRINDKLVVA